MPDYIFRFLGYLYNCIPVRRYRTLGVDNKLELVRIGTFLEKGKIVMTIHTHRLMHRACGVEKVP